MEYFLDNILVHKIHLNKFMKSESYQTYFPTTIE